MHCVDPSICACEPLNGGGAPPGVIYTNLQ